MKYFIALSPSLACKSGSVGSDGSVVSTTASSVYQTLAYTEAIWVQTTFFGENNPFDLVQRPVSTMVISLGAAGDAEELLALHDEVRQAADAQGEPFRQTVWAIARCHTATHDQPCLVGLL